MLSDLLEGLNPDQRRAVQATHGPVLVLAGAGSGKTRVLTHRIAYLIEQGIAKPDELLAVTFTNKAAQEMKERITSLLNTPSNSPLIKKGNQPFIGTFHALGVKILREYGRYTDRGVGFSILDVGDAERLIRQAMKKVGVSSKEVSVKQVRAIISRWKQDGITSPLHQGFAGQAPQQEQVARVYDEYEKLLRENGAYDFDDLLLRTVELLRSNPQVVDMYKARWRFLSVDEFQDTNELQHELLMLLLGEEKNLCAVGDDYQSIYSWRGARVDYILEFENLFPGCEVVYLTQNYRSTGAILEAANRVIAANTGQKHKKLWTDKREGQAVAIESFWSEGQEARFVREFVEGKNYSDFAVLYRTNAQSRAIEEEFLLHRIPYVIVGGFRFYDRLEVKDSLALLQLHENPQSWLALSRLSGPLLPGVGPKTLERIALEAERLGISVSDYVISSGAVKRELLNLFQVVSRVRSKEFDSVGDRLSELIIDSGYERYLKTQPDGDERWENVEELINVSSERQDVAEFLEEAALLSDLDQVDASEPRVMCMTLHAAKGLEFPHVILTGLEDGLLPHMNSVDTSADLEEERRLLYVGMTRAQETLTLTWSQARMMHGARSIQMPSRFLSELPAVSHHEVHEDVPTVDSDELLPRIRF